MPKSFLYIQHKQAKYIIIVLYWVDKILLTTVFIYTIILDPDVYHSSYLKFFTREIAAKFNISLALEPMEITCTLFVMPVKIGPIIYELLDDFCNNFKAIMVDSELGIIKIFAEADSLQNG